MDFKPASAADVIHDLNTFPGSFEDTRFGHIVCKHALEHLHWPVKAMEELLRLARPGAMNEMVTPHYSSPDSWGDITHYMH